MQLLTRASVIALTLFSSPAAVPAQSPPPNHPLPANPAPKLPDTPAARQLDGWLRAFNSGDADTLRKFLTTNLSVAAVKEMPVSDRIERELFVFRDTGGLVLLDVKPSGPKSVAAIARMKKRPDRVRVTLKLADSAQAIDAIAVRRLPRQPALNTPKGKLSDAEIVSQLSKFLDGEAKHDRFSGAVLVAKNGQAIFQKAYGYADRSAKVPNRLETRFNLGSMNKMFTSVAIMQLVERGQLALTDPIAKSLPDYPDQDIAREVTVQQLLSHTSGLGDFFGPKFFSAKRKPEKLADFLPFFVGQPLAFPPGTRFRYSNAGFLVLGLIVEKVSGMSYFDYVKKNIYDPAGMIHTAHRFPASEQTAVAIGYIRSESAPDSWTRGPELGMGSSAGGGYSTVLDLLQFDRALREHRLLTAKSTALVTTATKFNDAGFGYAYGFGNELVNGHRLYGHNGGAPGVAAQFDCYADLAYTVIILSNFDYSEISSVIQTTRDLIAR